jgi:hypothetical protein
MGGEEGVGGGVQGGVEDGQRGEGVSVRSGGRKPPPSTVTLSPVHPVRFAAQGTADPVRKGRTPARSSGPGAPSPTARHATQSGWSPKRTITSPSRAGPAHRPPSTRQP